jgi:hypothetical protein
MLQHDAAMEHELTNSKELSPYWEAAGVQLLKNFPTLYGTRGFITVFSRALYCSLSWARSIQFILLHPISLSFVLILSTHLSLRLPSGLFLSSTPPKAYMHSCSSHSCPFHSPWLDHSNYTWRRV